MNSKKDLVSVIIPSFNRPLLLKRAIKSVLEQSYRDFEIIVVNDGGINVSDLIESFSSPKIIYYNSEKNLGRSSARNKGIQISKGKYIAYLDDDDIYYPQHIEILVKSLTETKLKVAYSKSNIEFHDEVDGKDIILGKNICDHHPGYDNAIMVQNYIPILTLMHEKSCLDKTGYFDEKLETHEDWDLIIRLFNNYQAVEVDFISCEFLFKEKTIRDESIMKEYILSTDYIYEKYSELTKVFHQIHEKRRLYLNKNFPESILEFLRGFLFKKAFDLIGADNYYQAEKIFFRLKIYFPDNPAYLYYLGKCCYYLNNFPEAIENLSLSLKKGFKINKDIAFMISQSLKNEGKTDLAEIYYQKYQSLSS